MSEFSKTALGVAALRVAHQLIDDAPRILDDPIAARILPAPMLARLHAHPEELRREGARRLRSHVVLRSRFAEDQLAEAVARGVRQYVILGAGLDTFAYRQPPWAAELRIFEVDQPASQALKVDLLRQAGIAAPANLVFASVDFETEVLRDRLCHAGFDDHAPTFLSWLGVTMYLAERAIDDVLRYVGSLPAGSELVFTFAANEGDDPRASRLAAAAAAVGEPWRTVFTVDELAKKLHDVGFSEVRFLMPEEATRRYFMHRTDGLPPPTRPGIVSARV